MKTLLKSLMFAADAGATHGVYFLLLLLKLCLKHQIWRDASLSGTTVVSVTLREGPVD